MLLRFRWPLAALTLSLVLVLVMPAPAKASACDLLNQLEALYPVRDGSRLQSRRDHHPARLSGVVGAVEATGAVQSDPTS